MSFLRRGVVRLLILSLTPFALANATHESSQAAETSTSSSGYDFSIALPPGLGSEEWTLYFTSLETGTITVDYPSGSDTTLAVNPDTAISTVVPSVHRMETSSAGLLLNKQIRVTSTVPVNMYGCSYQLYSADCSSFMPRSAWGTRYRQMAAQTSSSSPSVGERLTLISGSETASVKIRFQTAITTSSGSFTAGQETSVTLAAGQIYTLETAQNTGTGFSRALVTSSVPIGMMSSNDGTYGYYGTEDTNFEMAIPTSAWGTLFYVNNYKNVDATNQGMGLQIIADQDGTSITISGDHPRSLTLNAGDRYANGVFSGNNPANLSAVITASKPVLVGRFMKKGTYNSGSGDTTGDPSLSYVRPYQQLLDSYTFINVAGFNSQFVNVVIPDTAISSLRFDGNAVSSSQFRSIGSTGWSSAQLSSTTGVHRLTASLPFGIEVYGASNDMSYAYAGAANLSAISTVAALQVTSSSRSAILGQEVCVPVTVKDAGDAPVTGVRVDGSTRGTNSNLYMNALTNSNGIANLCYRGSSAGTDTLTATANGYSTTVSVTWTLSAPVISYTPQSVQLASSASMPSLTPTNSGGTVASWSISPSLPSGLSFSTSTGVISGSPTTNQGATNYTVTATNAAGSDSDVVSISISTAQLPVISYSPSTYSFTLDTAINTLIPTSSGTFATWSVSPALPSGLSINSQSGQITGTPTRVTATGSYTVTATNSAGSASTSLTLTVIETAPDISFTFSSYSFGVNQAISVITPLNTGSPASTWTISPTLPSGLAFNTNTGQITGTPTTTLTSTTYTVTGSNSAGSDSASLQITVTASLQKPSITYSPTSYTGIVNDAITRLTPSNSGGTATSWSISPTLPTGVSFSTLTGVISGTPTSTLSQTNFVVTATNSAGSDTETVAMRIAAAGGATTVTLSLSTGSLTKGAVVTLTATASRAGTITFSERGKSLLNCQNRPTVSLVATCTWRPAYHGASTISARLTPTDTVWNPSSTQIVTQILPRSGRP